MEWSRPCLPAEGTVGALGLFDRLASIRVDGQAVANDFMVRQTSRRLNQELDTYGPYTLQFLVQQNQPFWTVWSDEEHTLRMEQIRKYATAVSILLTPENIAYIKSNFPQWACEVLKTTAGAAWLEDQLAWVRGQLPT